MTYEKINKLDVSIIIVSWNARKYLVDCLQSLQGLAGCSYEITVVDNNSSDGSAEIIEKEFLNVKFVRNDTNLGFSKANNIGIRESSGRYLCLVNSDVIVLDKCIGRLIDFMDNNPSVGMASPRILNPDRTLQVSCRNFPSLWNNLCQTIGLNKVFPKSAFFSEPLMKYWEHDTRRKVDVLSGCFWIIRREALEKVGVLDENFFIYGEDIDWCRRFHEAGWDVMFYPEAEAIHFGGASSSNSPIKYYIEMQRADMQYWRKHNGRCAQVAYAIIIVLRHLLRIPLYLTRYVLSPLSRKTMSFKLKRSVACIRWVLFKRMSHDDES